MDSSAHKLDDQSQLKWEIENNKRRYNTVAELIDGFKAAEELGIRPRFNNELVVQSFQLLSKLQKWGSLSTDDLGGILKTLSQLPEDLKDEKISEILDKSTKELESIVPNQEKIKELEEQQDRVSVQKDQQTERHAAAKNNVVDFVARQKEIAEKQRQINEETKISSADDEAQIKPGAKETKKLGFQAEIDRLVEQNRADVRSKIEQLGVNQDQAGKLIDRAFQKLDSGFSTENPAEIKKDLAEAAHGITDPIVRDKAVDQLEKTVYGLNTKIKIEEKSEAVVQDFLGKLQENNQISPVAHHLLQNSTEEIRTAILQDLASRDLNTGSDYPDKLAQEIMLVLPDKGVELTDAETTSIKIAAETTEKELSLWKESNQNLVEDYRWQTLEDSLDKTVAELNPVMDAEKLAVWQEYKEILKPVVYQNALNSFDKESIKQVEASYGRNKAVSAWTDTKESFQLLSQNRDIKGFLERYREIKLGVFRTDLQLPYQIPECNSLENIYQGLSENRFLTNSFERIQNYIGFIGRIDNMTGGWLSRISVRFGNFLIQRIEDEGLKLFAQNAVNLIAEKGLQQGLGLVLKGVLTGGFNAGSLAGIAGSAGSAAAAAGTAAGTAAAAAGTAATGGLLAVALAAKSLLKKLGAAIFGSLKSEASGLQAGLGGVLGGIGVLGLGIGAAIVGIPALIGSITVGAIVTPVIIGLMGGIGGYEMLNSNLVASLVPPAGMGGGGGQENIPTRDPNKPVPAGCPSGWPVNAPGVEITQGPATTLSHKGSIAESVDIGVVTGTAVYATHKGLAVKGESDGAGHIIIIYSNCDGKDFDTYYGHLSDNNVFPGQQMEVKAGDLIGYSGNTGSNTSGPHLHYQLDNLGQINQYLPKDVRRGCEDHCGTL